ncbi:MAG TPA: class I SAM-dependent methyltransferase [Gemmatimonadota bacterium]
MGKRYDRAYFDRWYRDRRTRVRSPAELERRVRMVLGIAECLLDRAVRSVLDVGCGEAAWQPVIRRIRPRARYLGLDPSPYALERFGRERNIRPGRFGDLAAAAPGPYDVVLCADVLHYVSSAELHEGLAGLRKLTEAVAYVAVLTSADAPVGDLRGWRRRSAGFYRTLFQRHGLVPAGMQCYVPAEAAWRLAALDGLSVARRRGGT